jgi:hypothetical protein
MADSPCQPDLPGSFPAVDGQRCHGGHMIRACDDMSHTCKESAKKDQHGIKFIIKDINFYQVEKK